MARPQENIVLTVADHQALETVLRSHKTPQSRALRAGIVLKSSAGETLRQSLHHLERPPSWFISGASRSLNLKLTASSIYRVSVNRRSLPKKISRMMHSQKLYTYLSGYNSSFFCYFPLWLFRDLWYASPTISSRCEELP